MSNILKFKVSSGIKDIVGKDLITDDFIAVFELVKNSYDAHAKDVLIKFLKDKIIIADNGKGMTLNEIKTKWLFLAYSAKKDNTEDKGNAKSADNTYRDKIQSRIHYAGSKGIGRFSADRLGKKLKLITRSIRSNEIEQIQIDWRKFNDQNKEFGTVNIDHDTLKNNSVSFPGNKNHGLILEIENVSRWPRKKIIDLKHSLEKLINPFSENNDFNIEIECPRELFEDENGVYKNKPLKGQKFSARDKVNGKVKNAILDILELKTTQIIVEINNQQIETRIYDRGTLIYHIKEANKNFDLLEDVKIDLFFLNTAAKNNFTRKMGIEPINFGSVFLFKNGFRVQPFGNSGDDSWGLDFRAQQGYNRFLGTRDLFGRIEIITEKVNEFKEVSSRDGGLVKTNGYQQLIDAFKEKALVRLERYVVGVLWGEGFKRKNYFGKGNEATKLADHYRNELKDKDKNSDNPTYAASNLGSKIDFIQLIKNLSTNKDIEILDFNREFVDLINERLDEIDSKYLNDLETIAEKTNDPELKVQVLAADKRYKQLIAEKEEAELKAKEEERKRIEAEAKAEAERKKREEAERKQKEEEELRRKAELATERKEKERALAELAKLKAENKAREEEENRKKIEKTADNQKKQIDRFRSSESITYKDLRDSNHIIGVYADDISKKIKLFKRKLDRVGTLSREEVLDFLQGISLVNEKINTITKFTTKSNFLEARLSTNEDLVSYIENYVKKVYATLHSELRYEFKTNGVTFNREFQPIELSVILDNILNNSKKKRASKVIFEFVQLEDKVGLSIKDIGKPLDSGIDKDLLFEEGVTSTKGAGLGLSHVKRILSNDFQASIEYNPQYTDGFELIITFNK